MSISRRHFLSLGAVAAGSLALSDPLRAWAESNPKPKVRPWIYTGSGPGRGEPPPHSLVGEDLIKARLTPETWRLEIVAVAGSKIEKPRKLDDDTAIDFATLKDVKPGAYELRVRTVDLNGFAQPQPRPQLRPGRNTIPNKIIKAVA